MMSREARPKPTARRCCGHSILASVPIHSKMMLMRCRGSRYTSSSCSLPARIPERTLSVRKAQSLCRRRQCKVRAASPESISANSEKDTEAAGPRCYLVPSNDGEGLEQICISEGKIEIGAGDSDYYFTANTGACPERIYCSF